MLARVSGEAEGGLVFNEHRISVLKDGRVLRGMVGTVHNGVSDLMSPSCTLKNGYSGKFYVVCILSQ